MKPVLQALVLADRVYSDGPSGKKIIAGTFNRILFSLQPPQKTVPQPDGKTNTVLLGGMQAGSPWVYISLTDVVDGTVISVNFVNVTRNQVIFGKQLTLHSKDRLATIELALPLPSLNIREAGTYALEIAHEGEILGWYRITAEEMKIE